MKKVIGMVLVLVLLVTLVVTGCGGPPSEKHITSHVGYVHDDVHNVGIWYVDAQGKFGGRHIFVLPDSEYSNPGEPWPGE